MKEYKKKQLINEAQDKAEEYLMENYEDVESVQINTDNYHFKPMGTLGIGGHINNEDKLTFYITFLIDNDEIDEVQTIVEAPEFPSDIYDDKENE